MKTVRSLYWKRGGILLSTGLMMLILAALLWENGLYSRWGVLMMIAGPTVCFPGAVWIGWAMKEVREREALKRRGLRVHVDAVLVSKKKGRSRYYIYAKCVSPVLCEEIWVTSPLLIEDPKPYLKDGVEVLIDTKYAGFSYMLVEELEKTAISQ